MENLRETIDDETKNQDIFINKLKEIETKIEAINKRNKKVETDKAWETSRTRFIAITLITYITMNLILWTIGGPFPPVHAIVPTCGYMLSTLTLRKVKEGWMNRNKVN